MAQVAQVALLLKFSWLCVIRADGYGPALRYWRFLATLCGTMLTIPEEKDVRASNSSDKGSEEVFAAEALDVVWR